MQFADKALHALVAAAESAGVQQVLPDRHGVAPTRQASSMPSRKGALAQTDRLWSGGAQLRAKVGDHFMAGLIMYGRFWVDYRGLEAYKAADSTQIVDLSTLRIGLNRLAISLQQLRHLAASSERFEAFSSQSILFYSSWP